jgi:uncharacterized membrane protein YecN with MAPEG domain
MSGAEGVVFGADVIGEKLLAGRVALAWGGRGEGMGGRKRGLVAPSMALVVGHGAGEGAGLVEEDGNEAMQHLRLL